jgi:hypothetical protein
LRAEGAQGPNWRVSGVPSFRLDAEGEDLVDLRTDQRARKAVLRDAESHHAARLAGGFEDRDVVAAQGEVVRGGHARRAPRR